MNVMSLMETIFGCIPDVHKTGNEAVIKLLNEEIEIVIRKPHVNNRLPRLQSPKNVKGKKKKA